MSRNRSVIFFAGYFLPYRGGYANSIYQLAKRLVERGYGVTIVTNNTENSLLEEDLEGILVFRLSCWHIIDGTFPIPKPALTNFKILKRALSKRYFVVSTQTRFFVTSFIGLVVSWIKGIPLVHTERGSRHSVLTNKFFFWISKIVDHIIGWLLVHRAVSNIGVSRKACDFLSHLGAFRVKLIPNGVNEDYLDAGERKFSAEQAHDPINIVYFGRLIYAKGVQDLIKAFNLLPKTPRTILTIVGAGNFRKYLESQAEIGESSRKIIFTGELDSKNLIRVLENSDIFVNPSYSEGLPTSVLEAGAVGLPVIATNVGGTSDIIRSDSEGLLYEPHRITELLECLKEYINNPSLRQEHSEKLREYIRNNFSWQKVTDEYINLFSKIN